MNPQSIDPIQPRTAAEWFAARKGARNAQLEQNFSLWLAESTHHLEEYALCELTWELTGSAAAGLAPTNTTRRYRRPALAAGLAALLILAFGLFSWLRPDSPSVTVWRTRPGEQLNVTLEEGSHVTINTRSVLEVRMGRKTRQVTLTQGEAFFEVARDTSRPFIVQTVLGTVRAVGTRFNVFLDDERVEVTMTEGKALIKRSVPGGQEVMATAGVRAILAPRLSNPVLEPADFTRIINWRERRLEFDRVPLETALKEFSRYTTLPIRAASPQVGRMSISAVFKAGDVEALRATLKGAFGLQLVQSGNELRVVEHN